MTNTPCIGNDPFCPCQDGDLCHYKDSRDGKTKAMTTDLVRRIADYLTSGGLFNPEFADHMAVRDLLLECRDALQSIERLSVPAEPVAWIHWLYGPVRLFLNKNDAMLELDRLNREYPMEKEDRKMLPLYLHPAAPAPEPTRSQKLREAGYTRRPTWRSLPSDNMDDEPAPDAATVDQIMALAINAENDADWIKVRAAVERVVQERDDFKAKWYQSNRNLHAAWAERDACHVELRAVDEALGTIDGHSAVPHILALKELLRECVEPLEAAKYRAECRLDRDNEPEPYFTLQELLARINAALNPRPPSAALPSDDPRSQSSGS